jgi:hypothetical protein
MNVINRMGDDNIRLDPHPFLTPTARRLLKVRIVIATDAVP